MCSIRESRSISIRRASYTPTDGFDDELSTVGSTNVDFRSFEHNFEVNAFIYDTETALQMREIFLQDQRDCVQVFLKNWVKRPWYRKAAESVVRLMAPLL